MDPLVLEARAARQALLGGLATLEPPLDREAISALLGRESLGTAAIEGELLDSGQVRCSIARRLQLPLADGQPAASAQVEGLLDVLLEATSTLDSALTLATLHHWHRRLFAAGPDGLRAIRIGELRDQAPMQVLSGAIGRERLHFEAPPRAQLEQQLAAFLAWIACPPAQLDGLVRAGLAHLWFLTLHPYEDGNGRLARGDHRPVARPGLPGPGAAGVGRPRPGHLRPDPARAGGVLHGTGALPAGGSGCDGLAELVCAATHGGGGQPWRRGGCGAAQGGLLVAPPPQRLQQPAKDAAVLIASAGQNASLRMGGPDPEARRGPGTKGANGGTG